MHHLLLYNANKITTKRQIGELAFKCGVGLREQQTVDADGVKCISVAVDSNGNTKRFKLFLSQLKSTFADCKIRHEPDDEGHLAAGVTIQETVPAARRGSADSIASSGNGGEVHYSSLKDMKTSFAVQSPGSLGTLSNYSNSVVETAGFSGPLGFIWAAVTSSWLFSWLPTAVVVSVMETGYGGPAESIRVHSTHTDWNIALKAVRKNRLVLEVEMYTPSLETVVHEPALRWTQLKTPAPLQNNSVIRVTYATERDQINDIV